MEITNYANFSLIVVEHFVLECFFYNSIIDKLPSLFENEVQGSLSSFNWTIKLIIDSISGYCTPLTLWWNRDSSKNLVYDCCALKTKMLFLFYTWDIISALLRKDIYSLLCRSLVYTILMYFWSHKPFWLPDFKINFMSYG